MEGYELQTGYEFIYTRLSGDGDVVGFFDANIYPYRAPQEVEDRFVAFRFPSSIPLYVVSDMQVWVESLVDVEVVGSRDDAIDDIADGIAFVHAALQGARGTVTNGQVLHCKRVDIFDQPYEPTTGLYPRVIQRYRVYVK